MGSSLHQSIREMGDNIRSGQRLFDVLTSRRVNAMMDAIRGLARGDNLVAGTGVLLSRSTSNVVVRTLGGGPSGSPALAVAPSPFDLHLNGTTLTIQPGTVNNVLPSNYLTGITVTGTAYISVECATNNGRITSASLVSDTAQPGSPIPAMGAPPTTFKVLIGIVSGGVATKVWGNANILAHCVEVYRAEKASPVAGQIPYDVYYTWEITSA